MHVRDVESSKREHAENLLHELNARRSPRHIRDGSTSAGVDGKSYIQLIKAHRIIKESQDKH